MSICIYPAVAEYIHMGLRIKNLENLTVYVRVIHGFARKIKKRGHE